MNLSSERHDAQKNAVPFLLFQNGSLGRAGKMGGDFFVPSSRELERLLLLTIQEPTTIALTVMYTLSFVVGFVGNIMSIKVLTSKRNRRLSGVSATRSLLINLAVCDLMVVCVCMPITLGHTIYTAWVYGDFLCRAVPFTQATSVSASVLSLTVISVNRYYSVHSPLNARSFFTWRKIFLTITVVWVLSLSICMPLIFMNKRDEIQLIEGLPLVFPICREIWPHAKLKQAYNALLFIMLYCIPVAFNLTISFLTGQKLWSTSQCLAEFDSRSLAVHSSRLKTRKKIAKMVVALVLLFAISWLPLYLTDIWIDREVHPSPWVLQLRPFAQWLGLTNSSLNPICYCFIGDLYRSAKVIKTRYHQRFISFFSSSFSEDPPVSTSPPKPLSLKRRIAAENTNKVDEKFSDWCPHNSTCQITQVSLHAPPSSRCPRNRSEQTSL
ncbi:galanin receptor type 1-like [Scleropages formosus]|uniref:Galanin receptor type 1-like n=1 Tax=Scleropages formosus TaxID=113540 RepID=A0A0P7USZ1_SCLFO|nr:galanin receptor type 1-like [Scleropages formosus]